MKNSDTKKCTSIDFFREAAPYIYKHRGKTFVIAFDGVLLGNKRFADILKDIAILSTLGVKIILVHGSRRQVDERLSKLNHDIIIENDLRVTDEFTMQIVKEAVGAIRIEIENQLTNILNMPPVINEGIGILSGNLITAQPMGVHHGIDYQHTGKVRKINTLLLHDLLGKGSIVLLSPLGFSPTGEAYNLRYENVASFAAKAIKADKLIFIHDEDFPLSAELPKTNEREELKKLAKKHPEYSHYLSDIADALTEGVQRIHLIDADINGGLLLELYTRDGVGTMFTASLYENIRPATIDDVSGILELIKPLEERGVLIKRSREQLELEILNFVVVERDRKIIACAACYPIDGTHSAELACLVVHPDYRGQKHGDKLIEFISRQARQKQLNQLVVLTTQTTDWFRERGFREGQIDELPEAKKAAYNYQRKSRVLFKDV
jgi:amino-acid N-acetyltransferase